MAGWFPDPRHESLYREAAAACAPDVALYLLDGNDKTVVGEAWAAADIFVSLVDNIQETFGITPLEAMAAGLPVVASDWDGYRFTIADGETGFLAPTLGSPSGPPGELLAARHGLTLDTYQSYVGAAAQHTAVDIAATAKALEVLIRDPQHRRAMAAAGRAAAKRRFDWPVVSAAYLALFAELDGVRRAATPSAPPPPRPVRGDPFGDFAGFPTQVLSGEMVLRLRGRDAVARLEATRGVRLDQTFAHVRLPMEGARLLLVKLEGGPITVEALLEGLPPGRRAWGATTLVWLAKLGLIAWD